MADEKFELVSSYQPTGDQPQAIETLVKGVERGDRCQTLLGVTGSGKTFTMANVIAKCNRPTLVLAHNKTLAAQLCTEFRSFFPNNAVEYFVSYYDYYQPEAYVPSSDTYIAKDSARNDEIDKLRLSATSALSGNLLYTVEDGKKGELVSDGILQVTYSEEEKETVDGESEYVEVDKTDYYDLKGKKLFSEMDTADSKMVLEPSEEV